MISAVVSARIAGLDRIKSGFTSRFANRLPIFGASRLPRSSNGRSLSGNAVSSQLDLAWRTRNSIFMAHHKRMSNPGSHPAQNSGDLILGRASDDRQQAAVIFRRSQTDPKRKFGSAQSSRSNRFR